MKRAVGGVDLWAAAVPAPKPNNDQGRAQGHRTITANPPCLLAPCPDRESWAGCPARQQDPDGALPSRRHSRSSRGLDWLGSLILFRAKSPSALVKRPGRMLPSSCGRSRRNECIREAAGR